jgi:hypothetical protein
MGGGGGFIVQGLFYALQAIKIHSIAHFVVFIFATIFFCPTNEPMPNVAWSH